MSLFPVPHPAHLHDGTPVLWFGVVELHERVGDVEQSRPAALVATAHGRIEVLPLNAFKADVRYVPDMHAVNEAMDAKPGWVDLEDVVAGKVEAAKAAAVEALTEPSEPPKAEQDYILGSDGTKFDPLTNLPIDE